MVKVRGGKEIEIGKEAWSKIELKKVYSDRYQWMNSKKLNNWVNVQCDKRRTGGEKSRGIEKEGEWILFTNGGNILWHGKTVEAKRKNMGILLDSIIDVHLQKKKKKMNE